MKFFKNLFKRKNNDVNPAPIEWWRWVKEIKEAEAEIPNKYILKSKRVIYLSNKEFEELKELFKNERN